MTTPMEEMMTEIHRAEGLSLDRFGVKMETPRRDMEADPAYQDRLKVRARFLYDTRGGLAVDAVLRDQAAEVPAESMGFDAPLGPPESLTVELIETAGPHSLDWAGAQLGLGRFNSPPEPDSHFRSRILEKMGAKPTAKTRWTEVPPLAMEEVARVLTESYGKHGPTRARTVPPDDDMDAALRHLSAYRRGEVRSDHGLHHLAHTAARLMLIVETELKGGTNGD